jgi:NitT/TauT family transport system permease protein
MSHNPKLIHQEHLKKLKTERTKVTIVQFLILIGFFGLWEISAKLKWIDPLLFSQPSKIWNLFLLKGFDGSLLPHISTTLFETVLGFILGTLMGTILATIIWWSPFLKKVLEPYLVILNSMPKVALGPLLIVGFGPGFLSIMAMAVAITVIITTLVIYNSFEETDPNYIKVIQTFGGSKKDIYKKVVLPASIPTIISTLKVNVGLAWVGVIVGEFLVAKEGLGYLIIYGFQVFNFTLVLLSLLIIAVIASLMYQGVYYIEKMIMKNRF